jgi:hypothetical protein
MNNDFRTYHTRLDTDVCFSSTQSKFEKRLFLSLARCPISCDRYLFYLEECEKKATFMSPEKAKEVLKSMTTMPRSDDWNPTRVELCSRVVAETYNEFTVVDLPPDKCKCKCDLDVGDLVDGFDAVDGYRKNDWIVIEDAQLAEILTDKIVDARRTPWRVDEIYEDVLENIRECIASNAVAGDTVLFDTLICDLEAATDFFTNYNLNLTGIDECRGTDNILVVYTED